MDLDKFEFAPRGKVKISYTWGDTERKFESGAKQYIRNRIHAKKVYSFTVSGKTETLYKLVDFYNKNRGQLDPFYFTYDGITELCHFDEAISPKIIREVGKIVGFTCEIGLAVEKQKTKYPTPSEADVLPRPYGEITNKIDWNTQVIEIGAGVGYRRKYEKGYETLSVKFSGAKKTRDLLINLFNSHDKMPLILETKDKTYKVRFPDSMEITDHREIKNIVGFETTMDLEVIE